MVEDADDTSGTGRVAIVTGGSDGIGREVARKLAGQGYAIVIGYELDQPAAEAAVEEILAANGTAIAVRGDVADELDVERLFAEASEAFGGVDVVVHAAGERRSGTAADAVERTAAHGTFLVTQEAFRQLRDGGSIVHLSTSATIATSPSDPAASPSGTAMNSTLAAGATERGITINTVVPELGPPMTPAGIAGVVAFLVARAGHSIDHQVLRADGRIV